MTGTTVLLSLLLLAATAKCQDDWPRSIPTADGGIIHIFHPQPDSFTGNDLIFRAAFSLTKKDSRQPLFGSFRARAQITTDKNNRTLGLTTARLVTLRLIAAGNPGSDTAHGQDTDLDSSLRKTIESGLPSIATDLSIDRLITLLDSIPPPPDPSTGLNHDPPRILITAHPSILIFIEGIPRIKWNHDYALPAVANTPYTILASSDNWWYCYGGHHWYLAPLPEGPWQPTTYIAPDLHHVESLINSINDRESDSPDCSRTGNAAVTTVFFSNTPTELLRTTGDPVFTPIPGTHLRYAANTSDPLILDTLTHQYHLLIAGRWFTAPSLTGHWKYCPPDSLSTEFANIPEGSPADRILASVPGTTAAREAIIDAAIPQTATIDRRTATTSVTWDDRPKFIPIHGTRLYYALNTSSVVIRAKKHFYCVDKGVWYTSQSTTGPWIAATDRPEDIANIPPDCPVYNCKYVYIYGFNNNSVFTGYTGGYLQSYIDGNTLVYGTGYHYPAYTGDAVYPRPSTYGFNIQYSPWFGWCLGYEYSPDWFNITTAWGTGDGNSGWFGPGNYRPPYMGCHYRNNDNLYAIRKDLPPAPPPDLLATDGEGKLYRADGRGGWLLRNGNAWLPVTTPFLDRLRDRILRGEMRVHNFRHAARS